MSDVLDPLAPLAALGVRVAWIRDLGAPVAYVTEHRVLLVDADLSRAEVFAHVRRVVADFFDLTT